MSHQPTDDAPTDPTAERVAAFLSAQMGSPALARPGERELLRRLESARRRRRGARRLLAGTAAVSLLAAAGLASLRLRGQAPPSAPLSYRVDDSLLTFSDGSKLRMAARTRSRVVDVSSRGAKVVLDEGAVSVDIVHRPRAQWVLEAGPFRVNVHGTSFTAAWNPAEAVFDVRLASGAISVASPVGGPEIQMRAGQSLRVSLRDQTSVMGVLGTASEAPAPPPAVPAAAAEPARWTHRGWAAAVAENRAADVVADAERRGLAAVLERADGDDLWALTDAARYAGRYALARQALAAQRRRFPSSERARDAAFVLGRLHDGDADGPERALGWYDRYLAEARAGADVADALGRKMTLLARWSRRAEALAVARDYLRRFPHGTYANAARALVRSSTPTTAP